ncbi:AMP-binding protein [Rhodococcus marinonascens]|uniref:AMP-binding protein n=1 Tax=Rhodococcus marinonascens TaxID=38311 RepID=UPI00093406FB
MNPIDPRSAEILAVPDSDLTSLRQVSCGGETLPRNTAHAFHSRCPDAALYNEYGPTESNVAVTPRSRQARLRRAVPCPDRAWRTVHLDHAPRPPRKTTGVACAAAVAVAIADNQTRKDARIGPRTARA